MHRPQNLYSYGGSTLQGRWFDQLLRIVDFFNRFSDQGN